MPSEEKISFKSCETERNLYKAVLETKLKKEEKLRNSSQELKGKL